MLGRIWYKVLSERLTPDADFDQFVRATIDVAGEMYGNGGRVQKIVADAWDAVGLLVPVIGAPGKLLALPPRNTAEPVAVQRWRSRPAR